MSQLSNLPPRSVCINALRQLSWTVRDLVGALRYLGEGLDRPLSEAELAQAPIIVTAESWERSYRESRESSLMEGLDVPPRIDLLLRAGAGALMEAAPALGEFASVAVLLRRVDEARTLLQEVRIKVENPSFSICQDAPLRKALTGLGATLRKFDDDVTSLLALRYFDALPLTKPTPAEPSALPAAEPPKPTPTAPTSRDRSHQHARQAWELQVLRGLKQTQIAAVLNKTHGTRYSQGQISRMVREFQEFTKGSAVAGQIPTPAPRPTAVDPRRLELGARTDHRKV